MSEIVNVVFLDTKEEIGNSTIKLSMCFNFIKNTLIDKRRFLNEQFPELSLVQKIVNKNRLITIDYVISPVFTNINGMPTLTIKIEAITASIYNGESSNDNKIMYSSGSTEFKTIADVEHAYELAVDWLEEMGVIISSETNVKKETNSYLWRVFKMATKSLLDMNTYTRKQSMSFMDKLTTSWNKFMHVLSGRI